MAVVARYEDPNGRSFARVDVVNDGDGCGYVVDCNLHDRQWTYTFRGTALKVAEMHFEQHEREAAERDRILG